MIIQEMYGQINAKYLAGSGLYIPKDLEGHPCMQDPCIVMAWSIQ
jgi:hypothetical protein